MENNSVIALNEENIPISTSNIDTTQEDHTIVLSADGSNTCPYCYNIDCTSCKPVTNNKNPPGYSATVKRLAIYYTIDTVRELFLDDKLTKQDIHCPLCTSSDGSNPGYFYRYMVSEEELILICPRCLHF